MSNSLQIKYLEGAIIYMYVTYVRTFVYSLLQFSKISLLHFEFLLHIFFLTVHTSDLQV
jgi:hypothetical protein